MRPAGDELAANGGATRIREMLPHWEQEAKAGGSTCAAGSGTSWMRA
jgi:hypothetical protein